jgi:predicted nucleotidyltransferase
MDVYRHPSTMVSLVENMLDLNKRLSESKTGHEKTILSRQIEATDRQIDALVRELRGLTEEEIAIVEDAAR